MPRPRLRTAIFRPRADLRFDARFWTGFIALAIAWTVCVVLDSQGVFDRFDQSDLDHYTRTAAVDSAWSDRIAIVSITDTDYRNIFRSTSPLSSSKVIELIRRLQAYSPAPRVIAVDLLTADWPEPLPAGVLDPNQYVVWARDGIDRTPSGRAGGLPSIEWHGVAGHQTPPPSLCAAAPSNPPDRDGAVRRYYTAMHHREPGAADWRLRPTMPVVIASAYPDRELDCHSVGEQTIKHIRFSGEFHRIPQVPSSAVFADESNALSGFFSNRLVLIGGTYSAGRDKYWTPKGYIDGVEILAHAVESQISGHTRWLSVSHAAILSLLFESAFFGIAFVLRQPLDSIASLLLPVAFAFVAGWLLYGHFALFTGLATSMIGVPIGVAAQHYVEYVRLRRLHARAQQLNVPARD